MFQIIEGLYLGNREDARDLGRMESAGITHVVNCADELPNYHEGELTYLALKLRDPDLAFHSRLEQACHFIDEGRREGKVMVHCFAAISRSPSIVLAYLCHLGDNLDSAARRLSGVVWTDPDQLFLRQLGEHLDMVLTERELTRLSNLLQGRAKE